MNESRLRKLLEAQAIETDELMYKHAKDLFELAQSIKLGPVPFIEHIGPLDVYRKELHIIFDSQPNPIKDRWKQASKKLEAVQRAERELLYRQQAKEQGRPFKREGNYSPGRAAGIVLLVIVVEGGFWLWILNWLMSWHLF